MRGCVELWLPYDRFRWIMVACYTALSYLRTSILSVFYDHTSKFKLAWVRRFGRVREKQTNKQTHWQTGALIERLKSLINEWRQKNKLNWRKEIKLKELDCHMLAKLNLFWLLHQWGQQYWFGLAWYSPKMLVKVALSRRLLLSVKRQLYCLYTACLVLWFYYSIWL